MELLASPKARYLLEAGLDVLHAQTNEWVSEIAFWRDELAFYYVLMLDKTNQWVPENKSSDLNAIENEIVSLSGSDLDELQKAVLEHEKFLNDLLDNHPENEQVYRTKHRQLAVQVIQFEKRFKYLKKSVFALFKNIRS